MTKQKTNLFTYIDFCDCVKKAGFLNFSTALSTYDRIRAVGRIMESRGFDMEQSKVTFVWWDKGSKEYAKGSWDLLWGYDDKGQSQKHNTVTFDWLAACGRDDRTLRQIVAVKSIDYFMEHGRRDFVEIPIEELAERSVIWALTHPVPGGISTVAYHAKSWRVSDEDRWMLSTSERDMRIKCIMFMRQAEAMYKYHAKPFDIDAVLHEINNSFVYVRNKLITEVCEDGKSPRLMLSSDLNRVRELRIALNDLADHGLLHIYTGYAGTGKTYKALKRVNTGDRWMLIALSNLVAVNGASKAMLHGKHVSPCSIARYRYTFILGSKRKQERKEAKKQRDAENDKTVSSENEMNPEHSIMLDEFSQWSSAELDVLLHIARHCTLTRHELVIMGDTHQIPSFLGKGNLLYGLVIEYPGLVWEGKEVHRVDKETCPDAYLAQAPIDYMEGNSSALDCYTDTRDNLLKFCNQDVYASDGRYLDTFDPDNAVIVTGSNDNVKTLNLLCLDAWEGTDRLQLSCEKKVGTNLTENESVLIEAMKHRSLPVRCAIQTECAALYGTNKEYMCEDAFENKLNHLFLVNEPLYAKANGQDEDGNEIVEVRRPMNSGWYKVSHMTFKDFVERFDLRWAITVNRAQGLEWQTVWVALDSVIGKSNYNLTSSREAMYVAMSRSKRELHIFGQVTNPNPNKYWNNFAISEVRSDKVNVEEVSR